MQEEFVPYNRALKLNELGFNKPCFAQFYKHPTQEKEEFRLFQDCVWENRTTSYWRTNISSHFVSAPTYSQAFSWFRKKYDLWQSIEKYPTSENHNRCYYELKGDNINTDKDEPVNSYMSGWFDSYEEAELACLDKLIEIVELKLK